jgi:uncharacterized lipoprotein YajG
MNTKSMLIPLAASLFLMAGCATERSSYDNASAKPVNLLQQRADTNPALRTGLNDNAKQNAVVIVPVSLEIVEASGAERPW